MEAQVQNAIEVAWNPFSDRTLKSQAFDYLNEIKNDPAASQVCLVLFTREPRHDEVVRHVALEVVNNAVHTRQLDEQSLVMTRDSLMDYVRRSYIRVEGQHLDSAAIQNKVAQTLTYLFEVLYDAVWPTFFDDLFSYGEEERQTGGSPAVATLFYLRILVSVHDQIADQLVNVSTEQQEQHMRLKDIVRTRDAGRIAQSWEQILAKRGQLDQNAITLCLKTIGRWVSWSDISLVVNDTMIGHIFSIASPSPDDLDPDSKQSTVRDSAIDVFTEIVGKKMKANEKLEMMKYLKLDHVIGQLVAAPPINARKGTPMYDTDMAETVAKLVNAAVFDIVKVLDSGSQEEQLKKDAERMVQALIQYLLRFFSDEYDEVCSTVIPSLTDLLSMFRKVGKGGNLIGPFKETLPPILNAIIQKMRYDDTSAWGEEDSRTDEAEFQELRKRLRLLQQIIAAIDEPLYLTTLKNVIENILQRYRTEGSRLNWRDLDLALHETYLLGELAVRLGGLYQKKAPSSVASEQLIHMLSAIMDSDVALYPHPAVQLQFMEICVRYCTFFEQHPQYNPKVLENFVTFSHSQNIKVRTRAWYLFHRFVRNLRAQLGGAVESVVRAISDLLVIQADVPEPETNDEDLDSEPSQSGDVVFDGQMYLFEAVGCLASSNSVPVQMQVELAHFCIEPLVVGIEQNTAAAISGDERAVNQVHHLITAFGTLAQGFADSTFGSSASSSASDSYKRNSHKLSPQVSQQFFEASTKCLVALESLKKSVRIRTAARFAFARLISALDVKILEQLPQWLNGLLVESSTKEEIAGFLRLLEQMTYGFRVQISSVLDSLLVPVLQRVFASLSEPSSGTDDQIQTSELRRQYLNFLIAVLGNDLGHVFLSPTNQPFFESIISTVEHFASQPSEQNDNKLAMRVFTKMCNVWGGPNLPNPLTNNGQRPQPVFEGFDRFMITRFSALTWSIMNNPSFDSKDPVSNRLVGEIAQLQQTILAKTGHEYLVWLRDTELKALGAQPDIIDGYIHALTSTDPKGFKSFLLRFLQQARGSES